MHQLNSDKHKSEVQLRDAASQGVTFRGLGDLPLKKAKEQPCTVCLGKGELCMLAYKYLLKDLEKGKRF